MIIDYFKYITLFILAVFIQVLIFDNIYFYGYAHVFFYVIFILLLPFEINKYTLMILGFILGIIVDIFNNSIGMHAFATVFISFLRPYVLQIYSTKDEYEIGHKPGLYDYGYGWFIRYSLTLLFIHHFIFYFIEVFRFYNFHLTFIKIIISSIASLIFIILYQLLFFRNKA